MPLNATKSCCVQVRFINAAAPHIRTEAAYAHGAHLVVLDGIGLGVGMPLQVCLLPLAFWEHMKQHARLLLIVT